MNKKLLTLLTLFFLIPLLSGCWNYRSMDQTDLAMGFALDFDPENRQFKMGYETADLAGSSQNSQIKGKLVETQGLSIFDAIRNAKKKMPDKAFLSSAQILLISPKLAQEMDILRVFDFFLRDGECRETMCVALSLEDSSIDILRSDGQNQGIISLDLQEILKEDQKITASSIKYQLNEVYNTLKTPGGHLVLPVFRKVKNNDKKIPELHGVGIFNKENQLLGFLPPEETKFLLFVKDEIKGGLLAFSTQPSPTEHITLEILKSKTKKSFTYENGIMKVKINVNLKAVLAENNDLINLKSKGVIDLIQQAGEETIQKNILAVVEKIQQEFGSDVLGFGEMVYRKNNKLWLQISPIWEDLFPKIETEVIAKVHIVNSAYTK